MSKIDKLSVQGIRSFGGSRETISFYTPLTLIVGYNGSGKTTIIECLKYATTGEQPPNSKGGAFVHDPKLCGEKEVLAQVKLAFTSTSGHKCVSTRSLQLTVKKNSRSLKTLEGSLVYNNNGERTVISSRVAQMDEFIPRELGVSRAILDYVIFCHQDESLWPMSEPAALKKQFDQIFEAMRYTKAIDNLKVLRKKQGEELAKLKIFEEQDRINKEKGDRAEKRSMALQNDIEESREKCNALTLEMEQLQEQIREKHEQANSYLNIVNDLKFKRDQLTYREGSIADIKMTLEELSEDDEYLENALAQYEERMARYGEEANENKAQYAELQKDLNQSRRELSTKLAEQGKHQSDKDKYERQLQSRMQLVRDAAELHGFRGYDGDLKDAQIKTFNERIQKLLAEKKRDLDRAQKENARELDEATSVITDLEGRKATTTQNRVFAKQRMGAIDKRTNVLQMDINRLDIDEGAKAILDNQFEDVESRLKKANESLAHADFDNQLQRENEKLWQLETENEKLGRELMECTRLASERAQLDLRKKELSDRRRKLETLTNTWKPKLDVHVGTAWQTDTLEAQFNDALKRQNKVVADARQKRDLARDKQQKVDFKLKSAKDVGAKKTDESQRCRSAVVAALQAVRDGATIDDYEEEVKMHEEDVETYTTDISLLDALADYYRGCQKMLQEKNKCRLCDRVFDDKSNVSKSRFSDKLVKFLDPNKKEKAEEDLANSTALLNALRKVKKQYETYQRLMAELPSVKEEVASLEAEFETLGRQLEEHDAVVSAEEGKLNDIESLNKTVINITQAVKDIKDSEAQVDRIMSQQSSGTVSRSADDIHELQASCNEQIRSTKNKLSKTTSDRQRMKDQVNALELEKSELRNKLSKALNQLERKKDFQNQIQTLKEDQAHQRELISQADQELESIEPEIAEARSIRDDTLQRGRAKEQAIAEERDKVADSVTELKMVESDIRDYIDRGGPSNLAANQRAIASLEKSIAALDKEISDLTVRTNKLKQDIDNGDRKKQNISNNLKYRQNLQQLEILRRDIEELESRDADEDYKSLITEARQLENRHNRLVADRGSIMGQMKTKDEELERLLLEWEQEYKSAAKKYRESHIKVETTKAAIEDLGRYISALDTAIMRYHSLKMEEVNRIAGELWQSTYQGTDIDTILIRSDNENATTGRRSYNYRVCMVKQDTEMDMRGRCSAGQKVLASIIIRLALAESFGVNCGLIALDEPTTNLDKDNIKSLAESLHAIIKARQAQSNFQLIVITHDEEFLRHMRCSDFCDSFFRVRRDDKQNSVITKESITRVL
ncbi:DNA repair protein rad50 [Colletotrichum higginsianum IMI 349063]|uniref:DNA repair protein RAD50 n=3 Tax=Colletotrichum higginsianum TaxID=80884 RepID=A0A1B7YD08_COLHI|nr:DNA repair protein rad50 [Colletotrichum higginsianum IMI 349063]OBR09981.1 DNA repair protein rad50 [Colletotrichum higginsianum IMI 349063]TID06271.1 DNA repair protein RAD50 [Colletotrichum higginsianum]